VGRLGLFVAMLSFPRTVLSLKQSTEPMQVHNINCVEADDTSDSYPAS